MSLTVSQKIANGKEIKNYEFQPTKMQKKLLNTARKNRKAGVTLTLSEIKNQLGLTD